MFLSLLWIGILILVLYLADQIHVWYKLNTKIEDLLESAWHGYPPFTLSIKKSQIYNISDEDLEKILKLTIDNTINTLNLQIKTNFFNKIMKETENKNEIGNIIFYNLFGHIYHYKIGDNDGILFVRVP